MMFLRVGVNSHPLAARHFQDFQQYALKQCTQISSVLMHWETLSHTSRPLIISNATAWGECLGIVGGDGVGGGAVHVPAIAISSHPAAEKQTRAHRQQKAATLFLRALATQMWLQVATACSPQEQSAHSQRSSKAIFSLNKIPKNIWQILLLQKETGSFVMWSRATDFDFG